MVAFGVLLVASKFLATTKFLFLYTLLQEYSLPYSTVSALKIKTSTVDVSTAAIRDDVVMVSS